MRNAFYHIYHALAGTYSRYRKKLIVQLPPDVPLYETPPPTVETPNHEPSSATPPDDAPATGNKTAPKNTIVKASTWGQNPHIVFPNFKMYEFDSPDSPGSGANMHLSTLQMLQKARTLAGISFKVNSGYRTKAHNAQVGGVKNSSHTRGYAADIATTPATKQKILSALQNAGFKRIGIYTTFIHADNDPTLPTPAFWYY